MSSLRKLFMLLAATLLAWLGVLAWIWLTPAGWLAWLLPANLHQYAESFVLSVVTLFAAWFTDFEDFVNWCHPSIRPAMRVMCGVRSLESRLPPPAGGVTLIFPAYNEEAGLEAALASGLRQTLAPERIMVIDDGSTDRTSTIAHKMKVEVYYRKRKADGTTQGKAAGQQFGLSLTDSEYVILVDGDTVLKKDAIEHMLPYFNEADTDAVGGYVLPNNITNIWGVIRQFQYHFGFAVIKAGQNNLGTIFVSSGCFTAFRTKALRTVMRVHRRRLYRKNNPKPATGLATWWQEFRAFIRLPKKKRVYAMGLAEDQLYTWILMEMRKTVERRIRKGRTTQRLCGGVRFARDAVCYVDDPKDIRTYSKQGYRWDAGFFHNFEDYDYNLFRMGAVFGIMTNFNLAYALVGPILEVGGILWVSKFFFEGFFYPKIASFASYIGGSLAHLSLPHGQLTHIAHLFLSLVTFEAAALPSVVASFTVGTVLGFGWVFFTMWIPVMLSAWRMRVDGRFWITAISVFPFMLVHYLDAYLFYKAFFNEAILRKRLNRWDKGHAGAPHAPSSPSVPPLSSVPVNHLMLMAHKALAHDEMSVNTAREVSVVGIS